MKQKQTRRSVSMNGDVYRQLRCLCDKHEVAMSHVVQQLVECFLVIMHDKENIDDEELVLAAKEADKRFSWTTPAPPAKKEPIRGGGVHSL
jgi:hypothetical protein